MASVSKLKVCETSDENVHNANAGFDDCTMLETEETVFKEIPLRLQNGGAEVSASRT